MGESEWVAREGLIGPVAATTLLDCRLAFYRQETSGDVWVVTSGPLGTIGTRLVAGEVFEQVKAGWAGRRSPVTLGAEWTVVRIDELLIGVRRLGPGVQYAFAFADGRRFGGGAGGLPTEHQPNVIERLLAAVRRERWPKVTIHRHK